MRKKIEELTNHVTVKNNLDNIVGLTLGRHEKFKDRYSILKLVFAQSVRLKKEVSL